MAGPRAVGRLRPEAPAAALAQAVAARAQLAEARAQALAAIAQLAEAQARVGARELPARATSISPVTRPVWQPTARSVPCMQATAESSIRSGELRTRPPKTSHSSLLEASSIDRKRVV